MALLRIQDLGEREAQLAAEAAIRMADPQASITPDWRIGVVEVAGAVPTETLCASLRLAGFRVELLIQRPREIGLGDFFMLALQSAGFAVIGAVAGMILGGVLGMLYVRVNPSCESVTDGGACTSVIFVISFGAAAIIGVGTAIATVIIGGMRLAHIRRTGEDVPFLRL